MVKTHFRTHSNTIHGSTPSSKASDSEDEPVGALMQAAPPAARKSSKSNGALAHDDAQMDDGSGSGSEPTSDSAVASDDANTGSDAEYRVRAVQRRRGSTSGTRRVAQSSSDDNDLEEGPRLKSGIARKKGRQTSTASKSGGGVPRPSKPKPSKHSILSESEDNGDVETPSARIPTASSHLKFSDAPRKQIEPRRLPHTAFLIVPSLGRRSRPTSRLRSDSFS